MKARTLAQIKADPRVADVWTEDDGYGRNGGRSYWASLASGFNFDGCSCIHEPTIAELARALAHVEPGDPY